MGLFGRNATTVGLDIGSGLIKLVAISHGSGGPVLTKVAFTSVVNDAIVEGEVMDPGIVAEAIKGLLASAGIKAKKVVTAVGGVTIIKKIAMTDEEAEARGHPLEAEHVQPDDNVELDQILTPRPTASRWRCSPWPPSASWWSTRWRSCPTSPAPAWM